MNEILGSLAFIIPVGYLIWKWDKQRKRDLIRKTKVPPIDENSYS